MNPEIKWLRQHLERRKVVTPAPNYTQGVGIRVRKKGEGLPMLFLVFYFILFFVLIFQGTHVAGEVKNALGTVPEEVGQASLASARWGLVLISTGFLGLMLGLLGFHWPGLMARR